MSKEMRKYIDTFKERLTESENLNISDVRSSDDGSILGSTDAFTLVERVLKSYNLKDVQNGKYQDELAREIVNFLVTGGWMK